MFVNECPKEMDRPREFIMDTHTNLQHVTLFYHIFYNSLTSLFAYNNM